MPDAPSTVRVPRAWVFMVIGASVLGAAVAAILMVTMLAPRLGRENAPRSNAVSVGNVPGNAPANSANAPPSPSQPRPVTPPAGADNRSQPPREVPPPPPPDPEPEPVVAASVAELFLSDDADFRVREKGLWVEGRRGFKFNWGDRVSVRAGIVSLTMKGVALRCGRGCEFELAQSIKGLSADVTVALRGGRFVILCGASSCGLSLPSGTLVFSQARLIADVQPERTEVRVAQGSVKAALLGDAGEAAISAGQLCALGARLERRELDAPERRALEDEFRPPRQTLLFWDFEGELPCRLGRKVGGGANGSAGALGSSPEFAAIGSDAVGEFTPEKATRLRLWVKTNAPSVRLSFAAPAGSRVKTWILLREITGREWQFMDVALSDFAPQDKDSGDFAGAACGQLQVRMRFPERSDVLPSERELVIDEIEIYTPK